MGMLRNSLLEKVDAFSSQDEETFNGGGCFSCLMCLFIKVLIIIGLCYAAAWLKSL